MLISYFETIFHVLASTANINYKKDNYKKNNYKKNNTKDLFPAGSNSVQLSKFLPAELSSTICSELGPACGSDRKPATTQTSCSGAKYLWHNSAWNTKNNEEDNQKNHKETGTTAHPSACKL